MGILIETTRISSRTNKYQRGDLFKTDEKKIKKSSPRIGWFCALGKVETLIVRWPFIRWISEEGNVHWRIKLQKLHAFKEKYNKQVICCYDIQKIKFIIHPEYFDANNILSHPFIHYLKHKPNMVHFLSRQMKISLKKQRFENSVKHQIHQRQLITDTNGKTEYPERTYSKNEVVLKPG